MSALRLEAFRGQHGSAHMQSRLASFSFVDSAAVAAFYALNPNDRLSVEGDGCPTLMRCELVIENPLTRDGQDPFIEFTDLQAKVGTEVATRLMLRHADYTMATSAWEEEFAERYGSLQALVDDDPRQLNELYLQVWPLLDHPDSVADLKAAGIDGAVYRGSGMSMNAVEYRVFESSQVLNPVIYTNLPAVLSDEQVLQGLALDWAGLTPAEAPAKPRGPRPR